MAGLDGLLAKDDPLQWSAALSYPPHLAMQAARFPKPGFNQSRFSIGANQLRSVLP